MHPGQLIRKLRRERNWTQEDLAKRLYVTRQTVSAWEKGLAQPSSQSLLAAAKVFEISLSQLMEDGAADEPASTAPVTEQSAVTARDGALPVSFAWWPVAVLAALVCLCANSYLLLRQRPGLIVPVIVLFLTANLLPGWFERAIPTPRLRVCFHGTRVLQIFALSTAGSVAAQAILGALLLPGQYNKYASDFNLYALLAPFVAYDLSSFSTDAYETLHFVQIPFESHECEHSGVLYLGVTNAVILSPSLLLVFFSTL